MTSFETIWSVECLQAIITTSSAELPPAYFRIWSQYLFHNVMGNGMAHLVHIESLQGAT